MLGMLAAACAGTSITHMGWIGNNPDTFMGHMCSSVVRKGFMCMDQARLPSHANVRSTFANGAIAAPQQELGFLPTHTLRWTSISSAPAVCAAGHADGKGLTTDSVLISQCWLSRQLELTLSCRSHFLPLFPSSSLSAPLPLPSPSLSMLLMMVSYCAGFDVNKVGDARVGLVGRFFISSGPYPPDSARNRQRLSGGRVCFRQIGR